MTAKKCVHVIANFIECQFVYHLYKTCVHHRLYCTPHNITYFNSTQIPIFLMMVYKKLYRVQISYGVQIIFKFEHAKSSETISYTS